MIKIKLVTIISCLAFLANSERIPAFSIQKLANDLEHGRLDDIRAALSGIGAFSLKDFPNSDRYQADLENLRMTAAACLAKSPDLHVANLDNDVVRATSGSASDSSSKGHPDCLNLSTLESTFNEAGKLVASIINALAGHQVPNFGFGAKSSLTEAPHLDHLHVYSIPRSDHLNEIVPFHVDNGLFLLVTPDYENPLVVKDIQGETLLADEGDVVVVMGRGLRDWLFQDKPDIGQLFRPAPHAVLKKTDQEERIILARMIVASNDAYPDGNKKLKSFGSIFHEETKDEKGLCPKSRFFSSQSRMCEDGYQYCWMSCLPIDSGCNFEEQSRSSRRRQFNTDGRRAKSEGPLGRHQRQFRRQKHDELMARSGGSQAVAQSTMSVAMSRSDIKPAKENDMSSSCPNQEQENKRAIRESMSMAQLKESGETEVCTSEQEGVMNRPSSEYKVRYRPFNEYEYVDGRFFDSPRADDHPWYNEVKELRKQANDYKCRGWGLDLAPPHINELYKKQRELQDQAIKRESLAALSLAFATPRPTQYHDISGPPIDIVTTLPRAKKTLSRPGTAPPPQVHGGRGKRTPDSSSRMRAKTPQARSVSTARASRPRSPSKRASGSRPPSASTGSSMGAVPVAPKADARGDPNVSGGGWKVHKAAIPVGAANASAHEGKRPRPTSLATGATTKPTPTSRSVSRMKRTNREASTISPSIVVVEHPELDDNRNSSRTHSRKPEPPSMGRGRPSSRESAGTSPRPLSSVENHIDYFKEPVVKSPPEPTRVRSPEGSVRSPDPINWTVPLDTGKTFSVSHSVKDGDSSRDSPMHVGSDHSSHNGGLSHVESCSGTAVSLGVSSSKSGGGKMSSLAREARGYEPGHIKDSTLTRPALASSGSAVSSGRETLQDPDSNSLIASAADNQQPKDEHEPLDSAGGSSGLKCLEDPSFEFEAERKVEEPKPAPRKPMYRVLEDPFEETVPPPRPPPRTVDPMTMGFYDSSTSSDNNAPTHGSHPDATDVLEGAKEKFDKIWGK